MMSEQKQSIIYASLHTHSLDRFDSQNNPEELCERLVEMGAKGLALTQHGVVNIEPMRKEAKKRGLKFVPGIEIYVGKEHLILLSKDDIGWSELCICVTEANNKEGIAVATPELLEKHFGPGAPGHGHIISLSACINGVVAAKLRHNEAAMREINKLERRQANYGISPESPEMIAATEEEKSLSEEYAKLNASKTEYKKIADTKFGAREKQVAKMEKLGAEGAAELRQKLEEEKENARKAQNLYQTCKNKCATLSKRISENRTQKKLLQQKIDRWNEFQEKIDDLRAGFQTDEMMREEAVKTALYYEKLFGKGFFYMELQYHGIPTEKEIYPILADIARKYGIPVVATNDVHIVTNSEDELLRRQILRSLRFGESFEELGVGDDQLYLKSDKELSDALLSILPEDVVHEAISNIKTVFDACDVAFDHKNHYPVFPSENGKSANEMLEEAVRKGITWRFPNGMPDGYAERITHELKIIEGMGYADYHLIVKDFLEYGRALGGVPANRLKEAPLDIHELNEWKDKNGWRGGFTIGPGRGSAVGSLVCYLLGITALDPIKYNLLFERFLNPERVSLPDIDSDIAKTIRPKVIEYVQNKYGEDSVCGIMTTNAQGPKGTIRIAAKFYGYKKKGDGKAFLSLGDKMAKTVPDDPGTSFATIQENGMTIYDNLLKAYGGDEDSKEIIRWSKIIEGCFTAYGAHAAGIVISDSQPIKETMPLRWNEKLQEYTTQCDMISVEENGYLKMDFLGLRTLDIITECLEEIKKQHGKDIDPLKIPIDDADVYSEIFSKGKTNSVFQFESDGMKNMLTKFEPSCFEDLIILVAMFRPGPIQYIDGVISVKHGAEPKYLTPELQAILGNTYGGIVYQEQIMEIFQKLAGYSLGASDNVRRYMSKKKADKLKAEKVVFINGDESRGIPGCVKNGIKKENADALFDEMTEFAKYAFNKSHAAAYAYISYITAWLKYHYTAEFLMAAMNWAQSDKIPGLMGEAAVLGITVSAPDVNFSGSRFTVHEGKILFGLSAVKSVGSSAEEIISAREKSGRFRNIQDFHSRTSINRGALVSLTKAGVFDTFCQNRAAVLAAHDQLKVVMEHVNAEKVKVETIRYVASVWESLDSDEAVKFSQEMRGYTPVIKKKVTDEQLRKRLETEEAKLNEFMRQGASFTFDNSIYEDPVQKMEDEKELLGAYVTSHPIDSYPKADSIGEKSIAELDENSRRLYGFVSEIQIKHKKADNRPMAFLKVEDRSGTIKACIFTKQYPNVIPNVKEKGAYLFHGRVMIDEKGDERIMQFSVDEAKPILKRKPEYILAVESAKSFFESDEERLKDNYQDPDGHTLVLVARKDMPKPRILPYKVSDSILKSEWKVGPKDPRNRSNSSF